MADGRFVTATSFFPCHVKAILMSSETSNSSRWQQWLHSMLNLEKQRRRDIWEPGNIYKDQVFN